MLTEISAFLSKTRSDWQKIHSPRNRTKIALTSSNGTTSILAILFRPAAGSAIAWSIMAMAILAGIGVVTAIVYYTGGTTYTYPYLILLPIIFASAVFKIPGGLLAALIAALALGPWMPLNVDTGTMQSTANWLLRMSMFLVIAAFTGSLSTIAFIRQQKYIARERIDPVTGFLSPIATIRMVSGEDTRAKLPFEPCYAVVIAFEGLGGVLRALGIEASNKAIREIGYSLHKAVGKSGVVTRIHGSTYGILLPAGAHSIGTLASRLQDVMPNAIPLENFSLILLPRFGISKIADEDRCSGQPFRKAMAALNQARRRGTRVGRYSSSYDQRAKDSLLLISEFEVALREGAFELYYQAKVDLASEKITGAEALLRWKNGTQGYISPAIFIPLIERTNLIDPMTRFVTETALTTMAKWNAEGLKLDIALNLSPTLLSNTGFINYLKKVPQSFGIDPSQLEIEITETALMEDMVLMRRVLEGLKDNGFKITMDDFGTGYSSMKYLKDLPIQTVKLDQSFIRDLPHNIASSEIAAATVSMCKRMNYHVVAEGIETREALEYLREQGFDSGQGYYFAKPLPADEFIELVRQG